MTVNSFKKQIAAKKMDMYVPSPDIVTHFATSPPSSIYDPERSDLGIFCGSVMCCNPSIDTVGCEEICGLDDNMEDGSLETFLTQDVMDSFHQTAVPNTSAELWAGKLEHDVSMPPASDSPNPTLTQLNMEPDISFVNDICIEQDDSKQNYSNLDLLYCDMDFDNQTGYNTISGSSPGPGIGFVPASTDSKICETVASTNDVSFVDLKSSNDMGSNSSRTFTADGFFFSRTPQPQLIGIAAVIKPEVNETVKTVQEETNDNLLKLKAQSPNLHKLLSTKHPLSETTSEASLKTSCIKEPGAGHDGSAQIVPTSNPNKRTHVSFVKLEPVSPKSLVVEESVEEKWKDIEHFMNTTDEELPKKRRRCDSGSSYHVSDDDDDDDGSSVYEGKDGYDDSDDDYSDIDADLAHISPSDCESLVSLGKKQKQYFWQYNVQSKGPKGTRLKLAVEAPSDPHVLNDFEDPVFDECNTAIAGIRHGGKARKGDGNEITPNPRKLFMIGHQLLRLNRQISACQLGADVPAAKRNESRKEKNKLASRACRLKKKAQHEANKIKLYGLEQEHSQLNSVLRFLWPHIREKTKALLEQPSKPALSSSPTNLTSLLQSQLAENLKCTVSGHTTEYVNSVIMKVESGDNSGGLDLKRNRKT